MNKVLASILSSILIFVGLCGAVLPAHADNSDPILPPIDAGDPAFPTCDPRAFMMKTYVNGLDVSGGQLVSVDLNSPPPTLGLIDIGPELVGYTYNAMAYNPLDDFLYAIKQNATTSDNKDLLRIGSDGIPKYVATLPHLVTAAIVAEFDSDGFFYVMDDSLNLFKYDLSGPTPQMVLGTPFVSSVLFQDFGFYDGALWAISTSTSGGANTNYRIVKTNIDGPVITQEVGTVKTAVGRVLTFTSVFAAQNGIYAYDTRSGNFVKLDMSSNDINQMELQFLAQGPELPGSDGAKCQTSPLGLPAEIVVTKTSPQPTFLPGDVIDFTITVENQGPWGATDIAFEDPLPGGVTSVSWTCTPSDPMATCSPASGTGAIDATINLPEKDLAVTFQVTMQTDPGGSADIVNTATVTVPIDFTDDPSNNTSTATVAIPGVDFSVQKAGVLSGQGGAFTSPGDVIDYTVTVTNDSSTPLLNVTVNDPGPLFGGVAGTGTMTAFQPPSGTLDPGQQMTFTASYTITEQDLANIATSGSVDVVNTATVSASDSSGHTETEEATSTVQVIAPSIHLEKTGIHVDLVGPVGADGEPSVDVGDRMDYTFTIINTGSIALTDINLVDPFVENMTLESTEQEPDGSLAPGKRMVYTASHMITEADIDAGGTHNIATVNALVIGRPDLPALEHTAEHSYPFPLAARVLVEKFAEFDGSGIVTAGQNILYRVRITNTGAANLEQVHPVDNGPTFSGNPASGTLSSFEPASVSLAPGESAEFVARYTVTEADLRNAVGQDSIHNIATATGVTPDGEALEDANSAEAVLTPSSIVITKRAELSQVQRGGAAPFIITLKALNTQRAMTFNLVDTMPPGFTYLANTAWINGQPIEPEVTGRRLIFPIELQPDEEVELRVPLYVSAAVNPGIYENHAHMEDTDTGLPFGDRAIAPIEVVREAVFDCGDLIGRVFEDTNRNSYMDAGERGVPGARLTAVDGIVVTTDSEGRFHLTCADFPDRRKGSTFLLKLDPRSLPSGHRIISENPRSVRLTAGKVSSIHFATSVMRVVRVDINADAFLFDGVQLRQEWHPQLLQLIALLQGEPSVLRLSYIDHMSDRGLAAKRVDSLRDTIRRLWEEKAGRYRLEIESRILNQLGKGWDEPNSISWAVEH